MCPILRYAVQRDDGMYYNPDKPGDRCNPTFHKRPKLYVKRGSAERAKSFCERGINSHWIHDTKFDPVPVTIITLEMEIKSD